MAAPKEPTAFRIDEGVEKIPVPMIRPVMRNVVDHLCDCIEVNRESFMCAARDTAEGGGKRRTSPNASLILYAPVRPSRPSCPSEYRQ